MPQAIGIDLGTTYSAAARIDAEGKPAIILNAESERITPSVIWFGTDPPTVGRIAKDEQRAGASDVAAFFKLSMGDPNFNLHVHGRDYSPVDLSAMVLRKIKADCEKALGEPVTHAVITVPAYFNNAQREATIHAGQAAGLEVTRIINEPTAAALAYGLHHLHGEETCLVYDLGGGTFDVTLARLTLGHIEVLATDGDHQLGGKNWDDRIAQFLSTRFQKQHGLDPFEQDAGYHDLLVRCEHAKQQLTGRQSVTVRLDFEGKHGSYELTRDQFEEMTVDLMERTVRLTEQVLGSKGLDWSNVTTTLLVGGSTRMPMVRCWVERMTGKPARAGVNVDEAVALGASIQAAIDSSDNSPIRGSSSVRTVRDVISHSLGVVSESPDRLSYVNTRIIEKNLKIPTTQTRPFQLRTNASGDNILEVYLTQGESKDPGKCTILGRYRFSGITHVPSPDRAVLEVSYKYDRNGVVAVSAIERATKRELPMTVEPLPEDMSWLSRPPEQMSPRTSATCYLAFDLSGSMTGNPLEEAIKAAVEFVSKIDLTSDSIGLIAFADRTETALSACQDAAKINHAIRSLRIGSVGGGNGADPFEHAVKLLRNSNGPRYIIVLADGVWSRQDLAERRARACHEQGIDIISIGFGTADRCFLDRIASTSLGSFYTTVSGLADAFSKIAQALTEGSVTGSITRLGS
jgi:molecular chaperone DnaK